MGSEREALLPCPHCGGEAVTGISPLRSRVACDECGAEAPDTTAWNRRAFPPAPGSAEEAAAVERMLLAFYGPGWDAPKEHQTDHETLRIRAGGLARMTAALRALTGESA